MALNLWGISIKSSIHQINIHKLFYTRNQPFVWTSSLCGQRLQASLQSHAHPSGMTFKHDGGLHHQPKDVHLSNPFLCLSFCWVCFPFLIMMAIILLQLYEQAWWMFLVIIPTFIVNIQIKLQLDFHMMSYHILRIFVSALLGWSQMVPMPLFLIGMVLILPLFVY